MYYYIDNESIPTFSGVAVVTEVPGSNLGLETMFVIDKIQDDCLAVILRRMKTVSYPFKVASDLGN